MKFFRNIVFVILVYTIISCENNTKNETYVVKFETNGGTAISSYMTDEIIECPITNRNGYVFLGWHEAADCLDDGIKFPYKITKDVVLYAKWEQKDFLITFETNKGSEINAYRATILNECPITTKKGFEFLGWYDNPDFKGKAIVFPYKVLEDIKLYACWEKGVYDISFETNGGSQINSYKDSEISEIIIPEREGYIFDGWYDDENLTKEINIPYVVSDDIILYAKWKPKSYLIHYDLNGGENNTYNPKSYTVESDDIVLLIPWKEGYLFKGWYSSSDCLGEKIDCIPKNSYGDKYLYAKWQKKCELNFISEYGDFTNQKYVELGEIEELPVLDSANHFFLGWYTDPLFTNNSKVTNKYMVTSDVRFYARWADIPSSVTILPKDTDGSAGKNVLYVLFGYWPQTIKADNIIIDESQSEIHGMFTYYKGNDNCWYVKCYEDANTNGISIPKYSNGVTVGIGKSSFKYFKIEPIKWRVICTESNNCQYMLLVSEKILTSNISYSMGINVNPQNIIDNNYKYSNVRAFLNGKYENDSNPTVDYRSKGFLQSAFSAKEQNIIACTLVDNSAMSTADDDGNILQENEFACENTQDKIFLLSEREVTKKEYGFGSYISTGDSSCRIRIATDYAIANRVHQGMGYGKGTNWLLRSPYVLESHVYMITGDGCANQAQWSYETGIGIVPSLMIEIK